MTCYDCIHCGACSDAGDAGFSCLKEDVSKCKHFKNKADFVEVDKVRELIIRKSAEVSDYWQNDVKRYRAMQGYSNIEHDTDNFLRGYNEAVEDMLAILEGAERRDA